MGGAVPQGTRVRGRPKHATDCLGISKNPLGKPNWGKSKAKQKQRLGKSEAKQSKAGQGKAARGPPSAPRAPERPGRAEGPRTTGGSRISGHRPFAQKK